MRRAQQHGAGQTPTAGTQAALRPVAVTIPRTLVQARSAERPLVLPVLAMVLRCVDTNTLPRAVRSGALRRVECSLRARENDSAKPETPPKQGFATSAGGGTRTPDTRIVIPPAFGLAIARVRHAVGHNCSSGSVLSPAASGLGAIAALRANPRASAHRCRVEIVSRAGASSPEGVHERRGARAECSGAPAIQSADCDSDRAHAWLPICSASHGLPKGGV
jgi:hypothetical protein